MKLWMISLMALAFSASALAEGPCKDKWEAKHAARKALHECLESWAKDVKPTDPDPSSDCSSQLSTFVGAAKAVKACRAEHEKKH